VTAEQADAQASAESDEEVEQLNLDSLEENVEEPSQPEAASESATVTAPISQIELDDKTREIELPDKTDNELF
jgi:hypothetical protein